MKNKMMTYFLGLIVVLVWGVIVYRVFNAASGGGDDGPLTTPVKPKKEVYNDFAIPEDTTHLQLNYRDPFALVKERDTVALPIKKLNIKKMPVAMAPAFNWGFIRYSGYILNPGSKKLLALLSINGQSVTLTEGETKYQVKLIKNMRDSIKISFNGKTKFITRQAAL